MDINLSNVLKQTQQGKNDSGLTIRTNNVSPTPNTASGNFNTGTVMGSPTMANQNMSPAEMNKFLYETRLQNVFNDYQQSIATLNQQEQQSLQDAYFIRELSQKYLGEYASNIGVGDVSGNLLDIYSNYQRNVTDIQQNTAQMTLQLQQAYDQQSQAAFEGILASQQLQLDENAQSALFNIRQGNTNDMNWNDYLQSELEGGRITQGQYEQVFSSVYAAKLGEVEANIERNFFGFKTNPDGTRVPMTIDEYINANSSWLTAEDKQRLKDVGVLAGQMTEQEGFLDIKSTDRFEWSDMFTMEGSGEFNFTITDPEGNISYFASAPVDVDNDTGVRNPVSSGELTDAFIEQNPNATLTSGQTTFEYKGGFYYYTETPEEGGKWYRMINYTAQQKLFEDLKTNTDAQKEWTRQGGSAQKTMVTKYFEYNFDNKTLKLTGGATLRWANSGEFVADGTRIDYAFAQAPQAREEFKKIKDAFARVHGTDDSKYKNKMIYFEGAFYLVDNDNKLRKFVK